jgi:hypothetical protein
MPAEKFDFVVIGNVGIGTNVYLCLECKDE